MTEPVVEREPRQTLRPWSRIAARGLVVAGFAGGIWLLTSTAAHAAGDTGPGTDARAASAAHHARPVHHPARGGVLARLLGLESTVVPTVHRAGLLTQVLLPSGTTPVARSGCGVQPAVANHATVGRTRTAMASVPMGTLTPVLRLAGPVLRHRMRIPDRLQRLLSVATAVLLTALVATAALTQGHGFAGWARPAGVLVGGALALRRAPFPVVVVAAAATAAVLRLAGIP